MHISIKNGYFFIGLSLFIAMILTILPLPLEILWIWPDWPWLVLLYWVLALPTSRYVPIAFYYGILLDLLAGTPLGFHALFLIVMVFLGLGFGKQIRTFPMLKQVACVFLIGLLSYSTKYFFLLLLHQPVSLAYWLSLFSNTCLWPWLASILRKLRRRLILLDIRA